MRVRAECSVRFCDDQTGRANAGIYGWDVSFCLVPVPYVYLTVYTLFPKIALQIRPKQGVSDFRI